jgi:ABC-2 type transport system ATP-binding protein
MNGEEAGRAMGATQAPATPRRAAPVGASGAAAAVIRVEGLRKAYGATVAVDGVSFAVGPGEVFGLFGRNGAGKTTTLEMIEGLRTIDGGAATVAGIDVARDPQAARRAVGVQLQEATFFDYLTLLELLRLFADLYDTEVDAPALLAQVELADKARARLKTLSGGQKRRFSLAVALVNRPRVLFLDEPTSGLDPHARRRLWQLVRALRERGLAVVLTTHYIEEAAALCDRVAIMDAGRIVALDRPANLVRQLLATGFTRPVEILPADLEDVFLQLTGRAMEGAE